MRQSGAVFSDLAPSVPEKTMEVMGQLMDNLAASRALK
jgi:hypothetical protein